MNKPISPFKVRYSREFATKEQRIAAEKRLAKTFVYRGGKWFFKSDVVEKKGRR